MVLVLRQKMKRGKPWLWSRDCYREERSALGATRRVHGSHGPASSQGQTASGCMTDSRHASGTRWRTAEPLAVDRPSTTVAVPLGSTLPWRTASTGAGQGTARHW